MYTNIPRPEYPRPEFVRDNWMNLNGEWDFEIDYSLSGTEREFYKRNSLNDKIVVPFCPESELSGINNKDFMPCVWYRRNIEIPKEFSQKRAILHFGAVDYLAVVYVNGQKVTEHKGGYTSFSADITDYLEESGNYITLCAFDDVRSRNQPAGKQSNKFDSYTCHYTRTTGIWQTVWLEFVEAEHIKSIRMTYDIDTPSVTIGIKVPDDALGKTVTLDTFWEDKNTGSKSVVLYSQYTEVSIVLSEKHLWTIGKGGLYDLFITLKDENRVYDEIKSYFGLRSVALDKKAFKINNEVVFGRWVLDQGYYPDGIYTAPSDEALKADIEYSMQLGFNGARLHEKVFEPRYLYWADKLGYLTWGEHANWKLSIREAGQIQHFLPEWIEAVERDFNHPSIIGWCPFNETWDENGCRQCDAILDMVYNVTKALDPTRPVIDTSGNYHVITDIYDIHEYEQDVETFKSYYSELNEGKVNEPMNRVPHWKDRQNYDGKSPLFVSEYGGIRWSGTAGDGWGYGNAPKTEEEFIERYKGLTKVLLENEYIMGFCYTQLYDVEQEKNGLMTYDRKFKFDPEIFRKVNTMIAKIESKGNSK